MAPRTRSRARQPEAASQMAKIEDGQRVRAPWQGSGCLRGADNPKNAPSPRAVQGQVIRFPSRAIAAVRLLCDEGGWLTLCGDHGWLYDTRRDGPPGSPQIAACPSGSEARHEEAPTPSRDQLPQAARRRLTPRHQQNLRGSRPLLHHPPHRPALRPRHGARSAAPWLAQPRRPWAVRSRHDKLKLNTQKEHVHD